MRPERKPGPVCTVQVVEKVIEKKLRSKPSQVR